MNMNFFRVIKDFYTGGNAFQGRMTRSDFWWWQLWYLVFSFVAGIVSAIVQIILYDDVIYEFGWIGIIYLVVCLLPGWSCIIKRMHDIGKSGWWCLILLIPYINIFGMFWILINLCTKSDGPNQYDLDNNGPEDDKSTRRTRHNRPPIKKRHNTTRGSGDVNKYPEGKKNY